MILSQRSRNRPAIAQAGEWCLLILAAILFTRGLLQLNDDSVGYGMLILIFTGALSYRGGNRSAALQICIVCVALLGLVGVIVT